MKGSLFCYRQTYIHTLHHYIYIVIHLDNQIYDITDSILASAPPSDQDSPEDHVLHLNWPCLLTNALSLQHLQDEKWYCLQISVALAFTLMQPGFPTLEKAT